MPFPRWLPTALAASLMAATGAAMNAARPLAPGEHMVGATFGGPMILGAPCPCPRLWRGATGSSPARSPLDVHYGLNLTAAAFGIVQVHGAPPGAHRSARGAASFTVANRLFLADNHLAGGRYEEADRSLWALNQTDLLASWQRERWLGYTGVSQLTDFRYAGLHLAPILGGQVGLGEQQRWSLQVESRYYGINKRSESTAVPWVTFGPGAMGLTLGVQKRLGGDR